jgi:hypothetical protein
MFDMPVLDFAISLVFIFILFAMLVSGLTTMWGDTLGWKNKFQENTIHQLFEVNYQAKLGMTGRIMAGLRKVWYRLFHSKDKHSSKTGGEDNELLELHADKHDVQGHKLFERFKADPHILQLYEGNPLPGLRKELGKRFPSQISKEQFYAAILNILMQFAGNKPDVSDEETGTPSHHDTVISEGLINMKASYKFGSKLYMLYIKSGKTSAGFQTAVENWYEDYMSQASKDYKLRMRWPLFAVGFVVALLFNIDAVHIADRLWNNSSLRTEVLNAAVQYESETDSVSDSTMTLHQFQEFSKSKKLPIGWAEVFPTESSPIVAKYSSDTITFNGTEWTQLELGTTKFPVNFFKVARHTKYQAAVRSSDTIVPKVDSIKEFRFALNTAVPELNMWLDTASRMYNATWKDLGKTPSLASYADTTNTTIFSKLKLPTSPPELTQSEFRTAGMGVQFCSIWSWMCNNYGSFLFKLLVGFALSGFLASFGAPFWFQILQRLITMRSGKTEKKAAQKAENSANA